MATQVSGLKGRIVLTIPAREEDLKRFLDEVVPYVKYTIGGTIGDGIGGVIPKNVVYVFGCDEGMAREVRKSLQANLGRLNKIAWERRHTEEGGELPS